ncbi:translocation/assembly module TamB domain-containing protein [Sphingobacterium lactis]
MVSKRVASYLSKELNAKVELDHIYLKPFSELTLTGFKLSDQSGKPLMHAKELHADLKLRKIFQNKITIEELSLEEAYADLHFYKDSSNFKFLVDYFSPKKTDEKKKKKEMELKLHNVTLINNHFKVYNHSQKYHPKGVDFGDLDLTNISGKFKNIKQDSSSLQADIEKFTLKDKSGFHLKELSAEAFVGDKAMEFDRLKIITNNSKMGRYLKFSYDDFEDFSDFIDKIQIESTLENTFVDSKDIEYFAPELKYVKFKAQVLQAKVDGTVSKLRATTAHLKTGKETELVGDFSITGLPYINKTIFDFQLQSLRSSAQDVEVLVPQLANKATFKLPEQLHKFGNIDFKGTFHGLYNLFDVNGDFTTALGNLKSTSKINIQNGIAYEGNVASSEFQLGNLLNNNTLKRTGFNFEFNGKGLELEELQLDAAGDLKQFQLGDYQYDSVFVNAQFKDKLVELIGDIKDKNIRLSYESSINFQEPETFYDVYADIEKINFKRMGIVKKDSILIYNTSIHTQLKGNNLNDLNGDLYSDQISMSSSKGEFNIKDVYFSAQGNEKDRQFNLKSNVVDGEMKGVIDLNTIVPYFKALAMRYAPAIGLPLEPYNPQIFDLKVDLKSFEPVSAFLDPNLTLEDGASLEAHFSSEDYTASFNAFSPFVKYKGFNLQNIKIQENADEHAFSLNLNADKLIFSDSLFVDNIEIKNILSNDSLIFSVNGAHETDPNYMRLNGNIHFAHNLPAYIKFTQSKIILNREPWTFNTDAEMRVSKGKFYLQNLIASQEKQRVTFNGVLSNEDDKLEVAFNHFNLKSLESILSPMGIQLSGELNGNIELHSIFKKPYLSANVNTTPLVYNQIPIGNLKLLADFVPEQKIANIDLQLLDELQRGLVLKGTYMVGEGDQELNLKGKLNETELILLQPFVRNLASNLQGRINADINIGGTLKNPSFNGLAKIPSASFVVNYLKTAYVFQNQTAIVDNNIIRLQNLSFSDAQGHQATAAGNIDLNNLSNPYIDVQVAANDVMILNTTYKDNNIYYGTAFATGTFAFKGQTSAIDIDIKAKSEKNTSISIPFNTAMTISDSDFIYFVSKDSSENKENANRYFLKGMTMNMDLELTPDAEVNLQTDLGTLKGNGNGEISLKISSLGDFEMFGDYVVNSGKFHFTAQDFINKYFDIKQGGTIRWTGSPEGANINMVALYQQRTSIGDLYNAAGRAGQDERVLAQADMIIKGTLSQPDVTFDLNFPQNPYVKDELQAYLSDANNVNQQALSLIIRRSFSAGSSNNDVGKEVNNTLLSAGTEIAFNQLNNILAQSLNINFLDFNIKSFNDASASFRFFNDRLVLTGGIVDRRNIQTTDLTFFSNQVATDAELTYKVRRDGSLVFRAYNRLNTRNILFTPTDDYINAVGLVYRQEFNTLGEFWRRMWTFKTKRDTVQAVTLPKQDSVKNDLNPF